MKLILFWVCVFCLCLNHALATPVQTAAYIEREIESGKLPALAEKALSNLIYKADTELKKRGRHFEAAIMVSEWENEYRYSYRDYASKLYSKGVRDIGDHEGISIKLQEWLRMLEFVLGESIMRFTHLSDLIVFNSMNVCFRPCTFPMDFVQGERKDEYQKHMAEGEKYWGLIPVVSFWTCIGSSFGTAWMLACEPIEMLVGRFAAPRLSDFIYERACE